MRHQTISFIKSVIRIVGYLMIGIHYPGISAVLVFSELLGILEEVGHE